MVSRVPHVSKANAGVKSEEEQKRKRGVQHDGPRTLPVEFRTVVSKELLLLDGFEQPGGDIRNNEEGDRPPSRFFMGLFVRHHATLHAVDQENRLEDALGDG